MDCSPSDFSAHGVFQARILEYISVPFPKGSSSPRYQTQISCIVGRFFTIWTTREAHQCNHKDTYKRKTSESENRCDYRNKGWNDVLWRKKEEAMSQRMKVVSKCSKRQRSDFPLGPSAKTQPYWHLDLACRIISNLWTSDLWNYKIIDLCCFIPLSLW